MFYRLLIAFRTIISCASFE